MQMDELACFVPGMLALGSSGFGSGDSEKFFSLAEEVFANFCDSFRASHICHYLNVFQATME